MNPRLLYFAFFFLLYACKKGSTTIPLIPKITSISPTTGLPNTAVTITGANFAATASDNTVQFNGVAATITSASPTQLIVKAPLSGTTGPITVTTSGGTATGPVFTYIVLTPPTITGISPASGPIGAVVTITGTNFKAVLTDNTVKFNGTTATVQSATTTQLKVLAPATGATGVITVTTADGTASGPVFTFTVPDIYAVGRSSNGPGYWKNGVFNALPNCLEAWSIDVSGTDVYVAGADNNGPAYWKNGVDISLPMTPGHNDGRARSVFIAGSDVYIAGYDMNNGTFAAPRCWKNGTAMSGITLGSGFTSGAIFSVFVSGSDVYLAGDESPTNGNGIAAYWKNGTPVPLSDGSTVAEAFSVFVAGSDAYVCGYETGSAPRHYWKNGTPVLLNTPDNTHDFEGRGIYVSGTDVYVVGEFQNLSKYWKNGPMVDLTTNTPSNTAQEAAFGISGNGTDIYIAGTDYHKGGGYWKNGVFTSLPGAEFVYSVIVK